MIGSWLGSDQKRGSKGDWIKFKFDQEADTLSLNLAEGEIAEKKEVHPGIILEFAREEQVANLPGALFRWKALGLPTQPSA